MDPQSTYGAQQRLPLHSGDIFLIYMRQLRAQGSWYEDELLLRQMLEDYEWDFDIQQLHRMDYDALALTDPVGSVEWVDAGFQRINGCCLEEVIDTDLFSFLGVRDNSSPGVKAPEAKSNGLASYEGMGIDRLGRIRKWRIQRLKLFNKQQELIHILTLQKEILD